MSAILRGVFVPLVILFVAFLTVFYAGMLGSLGPLDLDTATRLAIGLWIVAPVVGGLLLRSQIDRQTTAAARLGVVAGLGVAFVFLTAAGTASLSNACAGIPRSAAGFVVGCLAVGAIAGIGMGASVLVTARLTRRGWWLPGLLLGGGLNFGAGAGAYALVYSIVICSRP